MATLKLYSVKIATWGLPIDIRAYSEVDAVDLSYLIFKVPSSVEVVATLEQEPASEVKE